MIEKRYLGDSVYASYDGYHVVLTTENGVATSNRICIDQHVYAELSRFVDDLDKAITKMEVNA